MIHRVGFIPYLNMVPFHLGFGPESFEIEGQTFKFATMSPRAVGLEASKGSLDAGALSLADWIKGYDRFEAVASYGIGVRRAAQSVLVFSKCPLARLNGVCAVSDETSTSVKLLRIILEGRYGRDNVRYGRIASSVLFDGDADALLLIGDEALQARKTGVRGLPVVTDLGEEWYAWQGVPFVFARWAFRRAMNEEAKEMIRSSLKRSLAVHTKQAEPRAMVESAKRSLPHSEILNYWKGFAYELTPDHERSIQIFSEWLEKVCLTA